MTALTITKHARTRMAQRGISKEQVALIECFGTKVEGGYMLLEKDSQRIIRDLKKKIDFINKTKNKYIVIDNGVLITAYVPGRKKRNNVLRCKNNKWNDRINYTNN